MEISSPASRSVDTQIPQASDNNILKQVWLGFSCFAITIASTLGTGVLALPVTAGESGFEPFLVVMVVTIFCKLLLVLYVTELLQRTQALQKIRRTVSSPQVSASGDLEEAVEQSVTFLDEGKVKEAPAVDDNHAPDYHTMGRIFLHPVFRIMFELALVLNIISSMIAYSLAGPTSFAQLFGVKAYFFYFIGPFVFILTTLIIILEHVMDNVLTALTIFKGTLLITMIAVAGFVGYNVSLNPVTQWRYIAKPFLLGCVAMGGAFTVYPVVYSKITPTRRNIQIFATGCTLGILTCGLMIISWVFFILKAVPQKSIDPKLPTLERAFRLGEISTVPFIEVIQELYPTYTWLASVIQIFIMTSIVVSFIALGSGLKHFLDGYIKTYNELVERKITFVYRIHVKLEPILRSPSMVLQGILYVFFFGIIFLVAQLNPSRLFQILEIFTSFSINIVSGVFLTGMLFISTLKKFQVEIPFPLPKWFIHTLWFVSVYFTLAALFGLVKAIWAIFAVVPF